MPSMYSAADAFSEPETSPVFAWDQYARYFAPSANKYRSFAKAGGEQDVLYNQYKNAFLSPEAIAKARATANVYQDYARNLFQNQPNQFADYQQLGNYLYGKFDQFRDASASAGLRDMNTRLAQLGIRPGSSGYDRWLNATRITNNLAPAFINTTNAIGRDYTSLSRNTFNDILLRLGLAQDDTLNKYMDRIYERPLDVADVRLGQINADSGAYGNLVNNYLKNIAGYQTQETNDIARFGRPFDNWMNSAYSGYGGNPGAPNTGMPQQPNLYNNPYLSQRQDNQFMREFNGTAGNPYLNEISPYTGGWNNYPVSPSVSAPVGDFPANYGAAVAAIS